MGAVTFGPRARAGLEANWTVPDLYRARRAGRAAAQPYLDHRSSRAAEAEAPCRPTEGAPARSEKAAGRQSADHGPAPVTADTYVEVQQFYAAQMRLLDGGDFEDFGATFTDDGVFTPAGGGVLAGPAAIAKAAEAAAGRFQGGRPRHWFDMLTVERAADDTLHTSYYAVVSVTSADGRNVHEPSVTVRDVLVRTGAGLRNASRTIRRDDHLAAEAAGN